MKKNYLDYTKVQKAATLARLFTGASKMEEQQPVK